MMLSRLTPYALPIKIGLALAAIALAVFWHNHTVSSAYDDGKSAGLSEASLACVTASQKAQAEYDRKLAAAQAEVDAANAELLAAAEAHNQALIDQRARAAERLRKAEEEAGNARTEILNILGRSRPGACKPSDPRVREHYERTLDYFGTIPRPGYRGEDRPSLSGPGADDRADSS